MSEKRDEFLKNIRVPNEEELKKEKQAYFERLKGLEDNGGNKFWGARLQSEEIKKTQPNESERY